MKHHPIKSERILSEYSPNANVVLFHGDVKDFVATVPSETASLIITSPPYNIGKEYEKRKPLSEYLDIQKEILWELFRILKDDGSICWQVGSFVKDGEVFPLDIYYYNIFKEELKMTLRNRIIWHYGHGLHARKRFSGRYETILWFTKSDNYIFNLDEVRVPSKYPGKRHYKGPNKGKPSGNPKGKNPSDFWEVVINDWENGIWNIPNVKAGHPEKTIQPCQFPIELVERCVLALSKEGDWVFDPYAGVGSTLVASILHNRRTMGSEKEKIYYDLTIERLKATFDGTLKRRPLGKPIFQPNGNEKVARIPEEWQDI